MNKRFQLTIKNNSHDIKVYDIICKTYDDAFNEAIKIISVIKSKEFIYSIYENFGNELEEFIKSLKNCAMELGYNVMLRMI